MDFSAPVPALSVSFQETKHIYSASIHPSSHHKEMTQLQSRGITPSETTSPPVTTIISLSLVSCAVVLEVVDA